jgi:predicted ArsR family transcriptional regulator
VTYYNTNHLVGDELKAAVRVTISQDYRILRFFQNQTHKPWSPDQVWKIVFFQSIPLTSVRRSISNLTAAGYLEKLKVMRMGHYGRPVHVWRVKSGGEV